MPMLENSFTVCGILCFMYFIGSIPSELSVLTSLASLDLNSNFLTAKRVFNVLSCALRICVLL